MRFARPRFRREIDEEDAREGSRQGKERLQAELDLVFPLRDLEKDQAKHRPRDCQRHWLQLGPHQPSHQTGSDPRIDVAPFNGAKRFGRRIHRARRRGTQ